MDTVLALQTIGLNAKEASVYGALLGMKRGTTLSVAAAAGIKRPTAYFVLESLIEKKLVTSSNWLSATLSCDLIFIKTSCTFWTFSTIAFTSRFGYMSNTKG